MDGLTAIPVEVPPDMTFRDLLRKHIPYKSDMMIGVKLGTFYCHYGELQRRRSGDPEISDVGISNTEFEKKMFKLIENAPQEILDFINLPA